MNNTINKKRKKVICTKTDLEGGEMRGKKRKKGKRKRGREGKRGKEIIEGMEDKVEKWERKKKSTSFLVFSL